MDGHHEVAGVSPTRRSLFEDRYGIGATDRLLELLRQPCISFSEIATRFGVSRERVRQWHQQVMPDAPTGRARRRLCHQSLRRKQLVKDPLFREFVKHVQGLSTYRVTPIPRRSGYQTRSVKLDGHLVVLRRARTRGAVSSRERVYALPRPPRDAPFVYVELSSPDFLFVPRTVLLENGGRFVDNGSEAYARYKNVFTALRDTGLAHAEAGS